MNLKDHVQKTFDECYELICSKGTDYNDAEDGLGNFRDAADFAHITVSQSVADKIGTKFSRLKTLTKSGKAINHESLDDSIKDMINYLAIWRFTLDTLAKDEIRTNIIPAKSGKLINVGIDPGKNNEL